MNHVRSAVFFSAAFFLAGCAWLGLSKNVVGNEKVSGEVIVADSFVKAGKVIDTRRLNKGGKLLVVPFSAGANVAANERSDKIALMIVKGVADELRETQFDVLDDATAQEAQLVITGHVTASGESSKLTQWVPGRTRNTVSVEGQMVDARTNAAILVFAHSVQALGRRKDPAQSGYDIGRDIGRFINSGAD